jgi:hypothetical protein
LFNKIVLFGFRSKTAQVRRVQQGVQAQAPPDGAQAAAQRRKAVPMFQVPKTLLALGFVQPAHEPPLLVLQAVPRLS